MLNTMKLWVHQCVLVVLLPLTLAQTYTRDNYPSPIEKQQRALCGRAPDLKSYICDPDNILLPNEGFIHFYLLEKQSYAWIMRRFEDQLEVSQLDAILLSTAERSACPCASYSCEVQDEAHSGFKVGVALTTRLSTEPRPTLGPLALDDGSKEVARQRVMRTLNEAQLYALALHRRWALGNCTEDVLVLYAHDDDVVYTVTGRVARLRLTDNLVAEISVDARSRGFPDGPFTGLKTIVEGYRAVLTGRYVRPPQAQTARNPASASPGLLSTLLLCLIVGHGVH